MDMRKLPIGIENFAEIRREGFYYVDKTGLIKALLEDWGKVNLFTRPRRFGKTLNMSMLRCFFEIGADPSLFDGLCIAGEKALCADYLGKYPVVFVSLKGVDGLDFAQARAMMKLVIQEEAQRLYFLKDSHRLTPENKRAFARLLSDDCPLDDIGNSLKLLTRLLHQHYGRKAILLIDEYDVPLDKAYQHGYYREMVALIRTLFGQALKTNDSLYFAVLTGCLRVSKESIFTGLNNFKVYSIADPQLNEHFGFTDAEVQKMLADYGLAQHHGQMKAWYDGYNFGGTDVYCPWDVINYISDLRADPLAEPKPYWMNTSGNALVKRFVEIADKTTQSEIERLVAGEVIEKAVRLDLTYDELDTTIDNLWSVLFTTGYLTQAARPKGGRYQLLIPNREVREIFTVQIQEWFRETVARERGTLASFRRAFQAGDAQAVEAMLGAFLMRTISVLDAKARAGRKESFYHGLLLGLLRSAETWLILSNAESGEGFGDILVETDDLHTGIVIEVKYADTFAGLDRACEAALAQIEARAYDARLREDGFSQIWAYGIAFFKKRCRVVVRKL